jgi:sec-independent protein translocase protein TatB
MFDFDIGKLMVVAIVALAVIPPKDLPRVMRTVGQVIGKMRRMAAEFQGQFMDAMREADLENVRKELESLNEKAKVDASFDPAGMIRDEVTKAAAPHDVGTSEVALNAPEPAQLSSDAPARIEAEPESVGGELEARDPKASVPVDGAAMVRDQATRAAAHDVRISELALDGPAAPPIETPEASAKQSAAE